MTMNIKINRMNVHLQELHIWECSDRRLRMRRFPDPLLEESTNNQSAIACREAFLVSVYFIKKITAVRAAAPSGSVL